MGNDGVFQLLASDICTEWLWAGHSLPFGDNHSNFLISQLYMALFHLMI